MSKVVSLTDRKFEQRPVNVEFEARMRKLYVNRAATVEQVQPGYWSEIKADGELVSGRRVQAII